MYDTFLVLNFDDLWWLIKPISDMISTGIIFFYHWFSSSFNLTNKSLFKKGCCQLQAKVCAQLLVNRLLKPAQEKVWLSELTVPQWP